MAYLLTKEEMEPRSPYVEFVPVLEQGQTLYLPFDYLEEEPDLLDWLEGDLGFDYYGTVEVSSKVWQSAVEGCEAYPECEMIADLVEELQDLVADSLARSGKFFLRGL